MSVLPGNHSAVPSSHVPKPWTPLRLHGNVVHCWGREHHLRGPLPAQILSQGQTLLAGPIHVRRDGEPALRWTTPAALDRRQAAATTRRTLTWSAVAAAPARSAKDGAATAPLLRARSTLEYDGFWEVHIELGKGPVRGLSLEIPLASRVARYLHFVNETHYQEQNTLTLAQQRNGDLWKNRFACLAWIGDDNVGLAWCADTDAPFRLKQPERALLLHRQGAATTLRVTLIDHPVTLTEPLRWRFGLIATPVRPLPSDWRDMRLSPGASANTHILWWNAWAGSHADPAPKDPVAMAEQARQTRAKGEYLLPYVALEALAERTPVYQEHGKRWRREPFSQLGDEGTPYWILCPNTGWGDYFPKQMEHLCGKIGLNGLYFDFTFPYRCQAAHHPCGYRDPVTGARRGEFRVFALRKLAQETYERVKAARPDSRILMHTSGALMYPYIGFADLMLNGEQLRGPVMKAGGRYLDVLPLETLRAEYRGRHAGLVPFVIPEFATPEGMPDPTLTATPEPTRELLALLLLHDIGVWPIYCHLPTVEAVRVAQRQFGTVGARFVPYWERGGPAVLTEPRLLASAWSKAEAGVLLVLVNRHEQPVESGVRLRSWVDPAAASALNASDALSGEVIKTSAAELLVSVPGRGFRLLRLSP